MITTRCDLLSISVLSIFDNNCRQILSSNWCQSQRHAERMLKSARDLWTKIPEAEISQRRKLKIAELQQYKRSLQDRYKTTPSGVFAMLAVDKEIIKLEGLAPATKVEVTGKDGEPIQSTTVTKHEVVFKNFSEEKK